MPISTAHAQYTETLLHTFAGKADGAAPTAGLISDTAGNLYGTAGGGKNGGTGVIFKLTPPPAGQTAWVDTVLFTFPTCGAPTDCVDGSWLNGLTLDASGSLYGVASQGGGASNSGTVFKLTPPVLGKKAWTFTVLHTFLGGTDGAFPVGRIALDGAGNLYGTTFQGGLAGSGCFGRGCGTAYKLQPPAAGKKRWTKTTLYSFAISDSAQGPQGGMIFDAAGDLYGTTYDVNSEGGGQVFELSPPVAGGTNWTEEVLVTFSGYFSGYGVDGAGVNGGLTFDSSGNLYGTTYYGGGGNTETGAGTVFKLTPPTAGQTGWSETVLWSFNGLNGGPGGAGPAGDLAIDASGNLYGTAVAGGTGGQGAGTVFKLSPPFEPGLSWGFNTLYSFAGCSCDSVDGYAPSDGVIVDSANNLYGTTNSGGIHDFGVVFRLTP